MAASEQAWSSNIAQPKQSAIDTLTPQYEGMLNEMRAHFNKGLTKSKAHRKLMANQMLKFVTNEYKAIGAAVLADQGGSCVRGLFELQVISDLNVILDNWEAWVEDEYVTTSQTYLQWAKIRKEPKGVCLVIGAWNFPFSTALTPMLMMLVTGNSVVIKPSEVAPAQSKVFAELLPKYFPPEVVRVVEGAVPECTALLNLRFAHIMYTGNGAVGRVVMQAAAKYLTPCTLELGGKSPTFVDETADVTNAAAKIVAVRYSTNCGQICVAPDFVLVHRSQHKALLAALKQQIEEQLGSDIKGVESSNVYGRIVHARHVNRLKALLDNIDPSTIVVGNPDTIDVEAKYFPPLVVNDPPLDSALMTQEIFGPILPVIPYDTTEEAIAKANSICAQPLAMYIFSESQKYIDHVLHLTTSGGVGINTIMDHVAHPNLPFGGIGESGMGCYGSKYGIDEFSHRRAVVTRTTRWPKMLNSPIPMPEKGKYPDFLYGVARWAIMGNFSRETKAWIRTTFYCGMVGTAAFYANVFLNK